MRPDIDAIKKRVEAATEGPWDYDNRRETIDAPATTVADIWNPNNGDGLFIAHSRTDIPALLAYVEELEKIVQCGAEMNPYDCACFFVWGTGGWPQ